MGLSKMRFGGGRQKASVQPVMRHRRVGTPIVDSRTYREDDELLPASHDRGDGRSFYDFTTDRSGTVTPDVNINEAGS